MKLYREIIVSLVFSVVYVLFSLVFWFKVGGSMFLLLVFMLLGIVVVFTYLAVEFIIYQSRKKHEKTIFGTKTKLKSDLKIEEEFDNLIGFRKLFSQNKYGGETK